MLRRLLFLLALAGCARPTPPAAIPAAPAPSQLATGRAARVVLLSFDGLGADALAEQNLPAFANMQATGRVIPVNPTVTATTHVSLLTGAQPNVHGIVANRFHRPNTPMDEIARGLETDSDVETLVEAARRQGKRVGAVPFPSIDARSARQTSDFGVAWTAPSTPARIVTLTRSDFRREWVPPTWTGPAPRRTSFSPIMRARVDWGVALVVRADVDVVAYDSTNDARENYDRFFIETAEHEQDAHRWFAISRQTSDGLYGSWSKLQRADPALANVTIYWGAISRARAWPESFARMLDEHAGFWPGLPDESADAETFVEQFERLSAFLTRAQTLAIEREPFDLLLLYQSQVDSAAHNYLGDARVMRAAYATADRAVDAIRGKLDLARDALIVTGDHGLTAVDTEVRMNRLLADAGLGGSWRAFASGNVAHLYGSGDTDAVVNRLTSTGHFESIVKKDTASHRNSGDVVAIAKPNVSLTASNAEPAIAAATSKGQHGASNTHRGLHTVLFALGAGAPHGNLGEVPQTRIARFVAELLGIQPPAAAE